MAPKRSREEMESEKKKLQDLQQRLADHCPFSPLDAKGWAMVAAVLDLDVVNLWISGADPKKMTELMEGLISCAEIDKKTVLSKSSGPDTTSMRQVIVDTACKGDKILEKQLLIKQRRSALKVVGGFVKASTENGLESERQAALVMIVHMHKLFVREYGSSETLSSLRKEKEQAFEMMDAIVQRGVFDFSLKTVSAETQAMVENFVEKTCQFQYALDQIKDCPYIPWTFKQPRFRGIVSPDKMMHERLFVFTNPAPISGFLTTITEDIEKSIAEMEKVLQEIETYEC